MLCLVAAVCTVARKVFVMARDKAQAVPVNSDSEHSLEARARSWVFVRVGGRS